MKDNSLDTTILRMANTRKEPGSFYSNVANISGADLGKILIRDPLQTSPEVATAILAHPNARDIPPACLGEALTNASEDLFVHSAVAPIILEYAQEKAITIPVEFLASALVTTSYQTAEKILASTGAENISGEHLGRALASSMPFHGENIPLLFEHAMRNNVTLPGKSLGEALHVAADWRDVTTVDSILQYAQENTISIPQKFLEESLGKITSSFEVTRNHLSIMAKLTNYDTQTSATDRSKISTKSLQAVADYIERHRLEIPDNREIVTALKQHPNGKHHHSRNAEPSPVVKSGTVAYTRQGIERPPVQGTREA